jgi:hypothetical protein
MSTNGSIPSDLATRDGATTHRIFFLDMAGGRVLSESAEAHRPRARFAQPNDLLDRPGRPAPRHALDHKGGRMFMTDLAGSVYSANLDGSDQKTLLFGQGNLTGVAYAEIQPAAQSNRSTNHI